MPPGNVLCIVLSPELAVQALVPLQALYHHGGEESSEEFPAELFATRLVEL
jgi:hypothetical protein